VGETSKRAARGAEQSATPPPAGQKKTRTHGPRPGTLGAFQKQFFAEEDGVLEEMLQDAIGDPSELRPFYVSAASTERLEDRVDATSNDLIRYKSFSPPASWASAYTILKARFSPREDQTLFMSHLGEEILIPLDEGPRYHFYAGQRGKRPEYKALDSLRRHSAIRINPMVPHHGWLPLDYPDDREAWMIFRHASHAATSISLKPRISAAKAATEEHNQRRLTLASLDPDKHPMRYAMVAWGLSDTIELRRRSVGLSLSELSTACGIDEATLSRLERLRLEPGEGATPFRVNVPLSVLFTIADYLNIDVVSQMLASEWTHQIASLNPQKKSPDKISRHPFLCDSESDTSVGPITGHRLHCAHWTLTEAGAQEEVTNEGASSWILLEGCVSMQVALSDDDFHPLRSEPLKAARQVREVLTAGAVAHFRRPGMRFRLQALEPSRLVQVQHLHRCPVHSPRP